MDKLKVALFQVDIKWEKQNENLKKYDRLFAQLDAETDLVVLPELFATGFTMNVINQWESTDGNTVNWLIKKAKANNALILGSVIIKENNNYFNRLLAVFPDGDIQYYDKRHLFRMGEEHIHYTTGSKKLFITYKEWKIFPLICYDLRFPVWSRNVNNEYDLMVYIANWPEKRREHWLKLLFARAIENQSYVIGVNRIGKDGRGVGYSGDSIVIDPKGEIISSQLTKKEKIITAILHKEMLIKNRNKFPVYLDADQFKLI